VAVPERVRGGGGRVARALKAGAEMVKETVQIFPKVFPAMNAKQGWKR